MKDIIRRSLKILIIVYYINMVWAKLLQILLQDILVFRRAYVANFVPKYHVAKQSIRRIIGSKKLTLNYIG